MNESRKYFDPRNLAKLKGLRLRARHLVEGFLAGLHRSPHRGFSIEFAEHREYVPGDDLRYLDWKVFGRTDKFYLKQFEDETNLIVYFVVDVSESMTYRSTDTPLSKLEYAQSLAAALAWLVLQQQDAVGLTLYDAVVRSSLAPAGGRGQLENVLTLLESVPPGAATASGPVFHELAERFRKRGLVIILSDILEEAEAVVTGLKHFRHRGHDVILLQVLDRSEVEFPFDDATRFVGLESTPTVEADPRGLRDAYRAQVEAHLRQLETQCRQLGMDYQRMLSDEPLDATLFRYLATRMQRVR